MTWTTVVEEMMLMEITGITSQGWAQLEPLKSAKDRYLSTVRVSMEP